MNLDRWIAVIGLVGTVVGIALAYYFYRKTIRAKVLAISYTSSLPLMLPIPNVTVLYAGGTQTALSRAFILLWNKGTAPIEESDFITPLKIRADNEVLGISIHDKDAAAALSVNENDKSVVIHLLRPGEGAVIRADVAEEGYRANVFVEMKSADMSSFVSLGRAPPPTRDRWRLG
jgi:hypothetical protein